MLLRLTGNCIVRDTTKAILALTASSANITSRRLTERLVTVTRRQDIAFLANSANVNSARICGVEVQRPQEAAREEADQT